MQVFLCHNRPVTAPKRITGFMQRGIGMVLFLLVLSAPMVYAGSAAKKVTLSFKNAKIEQVFSEISKQTDYRFFYSDEVARKATPVSITVKDVDVLDLLNELMHGQSMKYKVIAGTIIINMASQLDRMDPHPVLSQQIIVSNADGEDMDELLPPFRKTVGLMPADWMEKVAPKQPDRYLNHTPLAEEPGGS